MTASLVNLFRATTQCTEDIWWSKKEKKKRNGSKRWREIGKGHARGQLEQSGSETDDTGKERGVIPDRISLDFISSYPLTFGASGFLFGKGLIEIS